MTAGGRDVEAALRRDPGRSDPGDEPELVARLAAEIEREGPITFARFMERALYEPGLGYYRRGRPGPGREGDFLTAPETHAIFGRAIGRQLDEVWSRLDQPRPFVLREYGAGVGTLARTMLDGLEQEGSALLGAVRYEPIEVEAERITTLAANLAAGGHGAALATPPHPPGPVTGVVLANEVLDALPVHRLVWRDDRLRELFVDWRNGRFVEVEGEPSTPALRARLEDEGVRLAEGQQAEVCLVLDAWVADAAAGLERGLLLLVDYGYSARELYGRRRMAGTLMAYVGHRAHDDPFVNVGRQDLTAHVDVTAVQRAADAAGLERLGVTTQAEFLVALDVQGLLQEAQADPTMTLERYVALRSGLMRLLDPRATGRFRVMAFGRGLATDPPLRGFSYRLPGSPGAADDGAIVRA
jgi:SAM-dependent MidA family methyltransferase